MRLRRALFTLSLALLLPSSILRGATAQGTVKNATTGQPAGGLDVTLIQLQGGMQEVANAKADPQGRFTFDHPAIGTQPMLVRAVYKGVSFFQPLPPGRTDVEVEVFEPSRDPKTISVDTHFVVFQPRGSSLIVGEEYAIKNNSQPPEAYYRSDGNFDFTLPEGAALKQVAAQGPSGMPVVQSPLDRGKNKYSIAYAFRPGQNGVRYSYELPYPGSAATVKLATVYPAARLVVVAAPSVQVAGDGLQAGGEEQGMNIYDRGTMAANSTLTVSLSGTAPPPNPAESQADPAVQGRDAQQGDNSSGVSIQMVPGRLDDLKLPIILVLVVMFAVLGYLLARKPVPALAGGASVVAAPASNDRSARPVSPAPAQGPSHAAAGVSANLAQVEAAVNSSLDALKDTLFRLELRRQAGTISEEEYAKERSRAEKILRDLVRG